MVEEIVAHPLRYAGPPVLGLLAALLAVRLALYTLTAGARPVIARRAAPVAAVLAELAGRELFTAQELMSRLDPAVMVERIEAPLRALVDETTVDLMQQHKPDLWEMLPLRVKQAVIHQARAGAPELTRAVLTALEADADRVLDLPHVITEALTDGQLRQLTRAMLRPVIAPACWRGALTGLVLGLATTTVVGVPGLLVAVTVLAVAAGVLPIVVPAKHSGAYRSRTRTAAVLAEHLADRVLTFPNLVAALVAGPHRDAVRHLVRRQATDAIDARAGAGKTLVSAALGGRQYQEIKDGVANLALAGAPGLSRHLNRYAADSMAVRGAVTYRFPRLPAATVVRPLRVLLRAGAARIAVLAVLAGVLAAAAQYALVLWGR